jgi:2-iminoacetate synthase
MLEASGHREGELALHAAHRLATASQRNVVCVAGIHFDALTAAEVESVVQSANRLTRRAARALEDDRLLASAQANPLLAQIQQRAAGVLEELETFCAAPLSESMAKARRMAQPLELFAPLYLSNACANDCEYCGFRRSARFARTTLKPAEALCQADALVADGHDLVELVTGEVPTQRFTEQIASICRSIVAAHPQLRISLNVGALSGESYRTLRAAGASECLVYQESYDPTLYFRLHRSGPKRDMAARLAALDRAAEAGFDRLGLGVLLGLGPWRNEIAALACHAEILLTAHRGAQLCFSLPRLRPRTVGEELDDWPLVSDDDFVRAFLFLRRRYPAAGFTLSSRESASLRDALLPLGVTRISAGVCTAPGGYGAGAAAAMPQFLTQDTRSRTEILRRSTELL